jgi:hypothetical protein
MIDDVPQDVRDLISASRTGLSPDAATVARLNARIHTAAAGAGTATVAVTTIAKVVAALVVIGASAAYLRHPTRPPAVAPILSISTGSAVDEPQLAPRIVSVEREPVPPPASLDPAPAPVPTPVPALAPTPAPVHGATLAREIELIDQASQALHRGDHAGVTAAIHLYETETAGRGQLAEDADGIALEAACKANSPDAATRLDAFTRRWPQSAQHTRLSTLCRKGQHP